MKAKIVKAGQNNESKTKRYKRNESKKLKLKNAKGSKEK